MNSSGFLLLFGLICSIEAYKVLVIYPFSVKSMNLLGQGIVKHLLKAGHDVTYVSWFQIEGKFKNLRKIDVGSPYTPSDPDDPGAYTLKDLIDGLVPMNEISDLQQYGVSIAKSVTENENFKKLLEDPNEKFDVVISDLYETEVFAGLSALYDCPMIWAWSMNVRWLVTRLIDEPTNPAYTADYLSTNILPFGFKQRFEELWAQIKHNWYKRIRIMPQEKEIYNKVFAPFFYKRGRTLPDYEELIYNASLIFVNDHLASGDLPSIPHNMKLIGGQHIQKSDNPLPKDLQKLMDEAKHGVIYFSMGTFFKSKDFPMPLQRGLVKMFGELKQTVIWKFEEELTDLPENVKIVKWAPQHSILDHPNCLLFVTHGGLLSSIESLHFGMPIVGVPVYFDQFININRAEARGFAVRVLLNYDLPANLKVAIQTILTDPKYRLRAQELSAIFHDRPITPAAEVVHWVEHVIKTKGAPHLRSPALHVPFYQKYYLDLAAIVAATFVVLCIALRRGYNTLLIPSQKKQKRH